MNDNAETAKKVRKDAKLEVMDHSLDFKFASAKIQDQAEFLVGSL
jgi:hypothetical protein